MPAYSQNVIINKLNSYLFLKRRPMWLPHGYCHGMSLLWLHKMGENKEQWYYDLVKKIADCDDEKLLDIELDIEKFLAHIEWMQNPFKYMSGIQQLDLDKIMETPKEISISALINATDLNKVLDELVKDNKKIAISGPTHTISIFKRDDGYHIFDSNYVTGKAKIVSTIQQLKEEVVKNLFSNIGLSVFKLPLHINVLGSTENKQEDTLHQKIKILVNILQSSVFVDAVRSEKNNLLLACEARDLTGVIVFLSFGADPNQIWPNSMTPLTLAVSEDNYDIMQILLNHKADPNKANRYRQTPLFIACNNLDEKAVGILLKAGANPIYALKGGKTPLNQTLRMEAWGIAATLLSHIASIYVVSAEDWALLRINRQPILAAMHKIYSQLPLSQRNNLERFATYWGGTLEKKTNSVNPYYSSLFPKLINITEIKLPSIYRPRF